MLIVMFLLLVFTPKNVDSSKLLLILMDGFRWDYFDLPDVAFMGFTDMFRNGVRAEYMISDWPTSSYPNYYSIMTGEEILLDWIQCYQQHTTTSLRV